MSDRTDLERDIAEEDELRRLLRSRDPRLTPPPFAAVARRAAQRSAIHGFALAGAALLVALVAIGTWRAAGRPAEPAAAPTPAASVAAAPSPSPAATTACYPESPQRLVGPIQSGSWLRTSLVAIEPTDRATNQVRWILRFELPAGAPAKAGVGVQTLITAGERSSLHVIGYDVVAPQPRSLTERDLVEIEQCSALTLAVRTAGPLIDGTFPYTLTIWKVGLPEGGTVSEKLSLHLSCSNTSFSCSKVDAAATPAPTAAPVPGVLDPNFGVIYWGVRGGWDKGSAMQVRREGETKTAVGELAPSFFNQFNGAVSRDGRRAVYFGQRQGEPWALYLLDGARPNDQRKLVSLADERTFPAGRPVWSGDGTGVAFTVTDSTQGVRPTYVALRTLDLASGAVTEVARVEGGDWYSLIGWDRTGGTLAVIQVPDRETSRTYIAFTRSGKRTWALDAPYTIFASPDAREAAAVLCVAQTGCSLWTWKLGDFDARTDRGPRTASGPGVIGWRPGTSELGIVVYGSDPSNTGRIDLWSAATGTSRTVHQLGGRRPDIAFFRADGSAIILSLALDEAIVIDIGTERVSPLPLPAPSEPWEIGRLAASIRLR